MFYNSKTCSTSSSPAALPGLAKRGQLFLASHVFRFITNSIAKYLVLSIDESDTLTGCYLRNVKISKVCYFHSAKIKRYCVVTSHFLWFLNMFLSNVFKKQRKWLVINRKFNVEYRIYFTGKTRFLGKKFHSCFALDNIIPVVMWLKHWRLSNQSINKIH